MSSDGDRPSPSDILANTVEHELDPERDEMHVKESFKNPYVFWIMISLIVLLFLLFITYFISFFFKIPLPETKVFELFMNTIIEIMKVIVPS